MSKQAVTVRLDPEKNEKFSEICKKLNINKQQALEKFIDNIISKNS